MIASSHPPLLQGFLVTSKVAQSNKSESTPYCLAARMIPGTAFFPRSSHQDRDLARPHGRLTLSPHLTSVDVRAHDHGSIVRTSVQ
jgi:hypothetical protein